jgi:hypothetical protein
VVSYLKTSQEDTVWIFILSHAYRIPSPRQGMGHSWEEKCMQVLVGRPERDYLLDPGIGGRIILKWILRQ